MAIVPVFAPPDARVERRPDGSIILTSGMELLPPAASMAELYRASAEAHPEKIMIAQREDGAWRRVTYGQSRPVVDEIAQALIDRGAAGRPVMILSGNSVEHLLLTLACMTIGSPVIPVSTAYSLLDDDHTILRALADLVDPALVFADDPKAYAPALAAVGGETLTALPRASITPAVEEHFRAVGPDTVAKILFTSGSTGAPKGVLNTHRMLCSNQQMLRQIWPFLLVEPPVLLDWLPWSHTFGGNHNLGLSLANGGSFYIDDGRPAPAMIERTLRGLAEVRPTLYFNVPAGYAALVPHLERDQALAETFFSRLRFVFFAAAALPQHLWDAMAALASSVGAETPMTTSWGATETAPAATSAHFASGRSECIGVPLPGVQVKLAAVGLKWEIRVKGPNVTPGYHRRPDLTGIAFDDDGFYRTGDAVGLIDECDPGAGLRFDGRIAEDFKLATGTWVSVGTLRTALLSACDGLLQDAALAGHDTDEVAALAWLNQGQAELLAGSSLPMEKLVAHPAVRDAVADSLLRFNTRGAGSSQRVARILLLAEPPSLSAGEITDKGYVNQRAVLDRRSAQVAVLLQGGPEVIIAGSA